MDSIFSPELFVITIGRSFGSGGGMFAHALGRSLGVPVYDEELISKAAEESNIREDILKKMDETNDFTMPVVFNTGGMMVPSSVFLYSDNYLSNENLFNIVSDTIKELAHKGSLIMVGRCSDFILRDHPHILTLFVTEKKEIRLQRIMERIQDVKDEEEAEEYMIKVDRQRRQYYNYYTGGRWGRCENYDLAFKLSELGIDYAVTLVTDLMRRKGFPLKASRD